MIGAHLLLEIFIEGEEVSPEHFNYIIWESPNNNTHKFYFEYYMKNLKIQSVFLSATDIYKVSLMDNYLGLKAQVNRTILLMQ